jgi:mannose-6-phosphate isomerase-like protein (cupin superfamily)
LQEWQIRDYALQSTPVTGLHMKTTTRSVHVTLADALAKGPPPAGNLAVPIFSHGSLVVELYAPVAQDPQKPHTRDEVYFIARGKGFFFDGERRHAVGAGSFLFVPAGRMHRFEDFSLDFVVWVTFYGPEGGESNV